MPETKTISSVLEGRVVTLERDVGHIEKQVDRIREDMATRGDLDKITIAISGLAGQAANAGRPNWQALSVLVGVISVVGAILYVPLNTSMQEMKMTVITVNEKALPLQRYDGDARRVQDAIKGLDDQIQFVRKSFMRTEDYEKHHILLRQRVDENKQTLDAILDRQREGLGRIGKLEESARVAEKNIDILFQRNYKIATDPPKH